MQISLIVAIDEKNAIGRGGDQLAYISDDLKRFKQLTSGHPIVMGRKTFEALPKGALPNRRNIVLSRNSDLKLEGCEVVSTVNEVIERCKDAVEIFIIGGGEIYSLFLPVATQIHLTRIHHAFENTDTWFPETNSAHWKQTSLEGPFIDAKSGLEYSFEVLVRR
jgi:dihydrofolate reductase